MRNSIKKLTTDNGLTALHSHIVRYKIRQKLPQPNREVVSTQVQEFCRVSRLLRNLGFLTIILLRNTYIADMSVIDDATLLKMAEAEILGEAKRAAIRHSIAGVSGWQPCPKPNKTFLTNTLLQTMTSNRLLTRKKANSHHKQTERKLLQKKNKTDLANNFVYQKPKKRKENPTKSINSSKSSKNVSEERHSKSVKKCDVKVKLKKS